MLKSQPARGLRLISFLQRTHSLGHTSVGHQRRNVLLRSNSELVITSNLVPESTLPRLEPKILNVRNQAAIVACLRLVFAAQGGDFFS